MQAIEFPSGGNVSKRLTAAGLNRIAIIPSPSNSGTATVRVYDPAEDPQTTLSDYIEDGATVIIDPTVNTVQLVQGPITFVIQRDTAADEYFFASGK